MCLNTDTGEKDTAKQLYGFGSQKHQLAINSVSLSCSGEKNPRCTGKPNNRKSSLVKTVTCLRTAVE